MPPAADECPHGKNRGLCPHCSPDFLERKIVETAEPDMNRATIRGTLEDAPCFARLQDGRGVVTMTVSTVHRWQTLGGERKSVDYHKVAIFDPGLHSPASNCRKGDRVELSGHLQTRQIPAKQPGGEPRRMTEIVLNTATGTFLRLTPIEEGKTDDA